LAHREGLPANSRIFALVTGHDLGHVPARCEEGEMSQEDTKAGAEQSDRSPWNWLLLIPIVLPLLTLLYNRRSPELLGFPFFYWCQLAFIPVGVATTVLVYQLTKRGR
jgi:hypothetical protein